MERNLESRFKGAYPESYLHDLITSQGFTFSSYGIEDYVPTQECSEDTAIQFTAYIPPVGGKDSAHPKRETLGGFLGCCQ